MGVRGNGLFWFIIPDLPEMEEIAEISEEEEVRMKMDFFDLWAFTNHEKWWFQMNIVEYMLLSILQMMMMMAILSR